MDKHEFSMFAMAIRTFYPKENILPNQQAMELWFRELCDIPYKVAEASLRKWVVNNKWSPSIAEIREMTSEVTGDDIPDWSEAWHQVLVAIRRYGSYEPGKALDSLPELARTATERIGYRNLCCSENIEVDRANFRMIYEQLATRKKKEQSMPNQLKMLIGSIAERKLIEGSEQE